MMNKLAQFIATCGPVGFIKGTPGTMGSLVGLIIVGLCQNQSAFIIVSIAIFIISIWASNVTANALNQKDPQIVVIDEVCGIMISFLFVSFSWPRLLVGFLAFRFFDIVKPPPVRQLERFPKGYGIVLDDVMAGIYANIFLQILIRYAHL